MRPPCSSSSASPNPCASGRDRRRRDPPRRRALPSPGGGRGRARGPEVRRGVRPGPAELAGGRRAAGGRPLPAAARGSHPVRRAQRRPAGQPCRGRGGLQRPARAGGSPASRSRGRALLRRDRPQLRAGAPLAPASAAAGRRTGPRGLASTGPAYKITLRATGLYGIAGEDLDGAQGAASSGLALLYGGGRAHRPGPPRGRPSPRAGGRGRRRRGRRHLRRAGPAAVLRRGLLALGGGGGGEPLAAQSLLGRRTPTGSWSTTRSAPCGNRPREEAPSQVPSRPSTATWSASVSRDQGFPTAYHGGEDPERHRVVLVEDVDPGPRRSSPPCCRRRRRGPGSSSA